MTKLGTFLVLAALATLPAEAAELRSVTFEKNNGIYNATTDVWLDAKLEDVYTVLSDWDLSTRFSSLIVASHNIDKDETGRPGFYMQIRACVLFFCRSFERQGYAEFEQNRMIRAVAIPEKSDFEMSDERWYFNVEGSGTNIRYTMEMKPKFWVPPFIGPYVLKRKIEKDGLEALQRIEDYVKVRDDHVP